MRDAPKKLTDRQRAVLEFIHNSLESRGIPPTLREIGMHLGIRSTNGVNDHLRALERKGYLTREDMKSRSLRLLRLPDGSEPSSLMDVPVLGRVAAGMLSEAIAEPEDTFKMDPSMLGRSSGPSGNEIFALRITGESMIEAGIHDGDLVFVKSTPQARKGQIVIAMVGDETTCKFYFPEPQHIRLEPANSTMASILIPKNDWRDNAILGVVVGVFRRV